ncbi:hypothetical protein FQN49_001381 [Arthroderma sp. PD_2]|nr:hypothetical protein FQN49_001381 [Arthroderma sp. PD_2]
MASSSTDADDISLSPAYAECIQSFTRLILSLSEEHCRVIRLKQVHLPQLLEEYGRTKIWGDQTKAELPSTARGSLDDTLRHDTELRCLTKAGIMVTMARLLSDSTLATYIAKRKYDATAGSDHDSISSVSADSDSDAVGEGDDGGDGEHHYRRMPKIRLLVQQIVEQISSLYDLSSLLRRPTIWNKYISSLPSKPDTVTLGNIDENHIAEKLLQWRGLTKSAHSVKFEDEEVAPQRQGRAVDGIEDILWFCHRLARANARRREQLRYWVDHPYSSRQDTANAFNPGLEQLPVGRRPVQASESQASTLKPPNSDLPSKEPKTGISMQSFSTAAISDIHDTNTNVRPLTVYSPTVVGSKRSNYIPSLPKAASENKTFLCPYCGATLESSKMKNEQSWMRHLFRDLRPYVCTFKNCQNSGKLFVTRRDWIYHELQIHRREFSCNQCHKVKSSRQDMSRHLREDHSESISPTHLEIILDLSSRQVDVSDSKKDPCLICGEEFSLHNLQKHLSHHMEDLALFVLSNTHEEEEGGGSKDSVRVVNLRSQGIAADTKSEASSLGYSDTGSRGQDPTEFAKVFTYEEEGYASKFSCWEIEDPDQEVIRTQDPGQFDGEPAKSQLYKGLTIEGDIYGQLRFLFKVDYIEPVDLQFGSDGIWLPTNDGLFETVHSTGWLQRTPERVSIPKNMDGIDFGVNSLLYRSSTSHFLAVPIDCRSSSMQKRLIRTGNSWRRLYFRNDEGRNLSSVTYTASNFTLAGQGSHDWIPEILPATYRYNSSENTPFTHLTGDLALIIGLVAFSCPRERDTSCLIDVMQRCFRPPRWVRHRSDPERIDRHGVVVNIRIDPEAGNMSVSEEHLRKFVNGDYGPLLMASELSRLT